MITELEPEQTPVRLPRRLKRFCALLRRLWAELRVRQYVYFVSGPQNLPAPLSPEEEKQVFERLPLGAAEARRMVGPQSRRGVV